MLIGLEVELRSSNLRIHDIAKREGLNFESFVMKSGLNVKMSVEYYQRTIEYNFEPQPLSKVYLNKVKAFIEGQMIKYQLEICGISPKYVGTHVHIFDIKYRKLKGDEILKTSMGFINNEFDSLQLNSRRRLALSHHLWGNYVYNEYQEYYGYAEREGLSMALTGIAANKKKYNPILISRRSNKGKPRSVEIRIIPNEFLFNNKLYELLSKIKKGEHTNTSVKITLRKWLVKLNR